VFNGSTIFIQNPEEPIGIGTLITITVNHYRDEIYYHAVGDLPIQCKSLEEALTMAVRELHKKEEI